MGRYFHCLGIVGMHVVDLILCCARVSAWVRFGEKIVAYNYLPNRAFKAGLQHYFRHTTVSRRLTMELFQTCTKCQRTTTQGNNWSRQDRETILHIQYNFHVQIYDHLKSKKWSSKYFHLKFGSTLLLGTKLVLGCI